MKQIIVIIFGIIKKIIDFSLVFLIAGTFIGITFWFYDDIYTKLPKITPEIFSQRPETTKITDRNGIILFKLYEENREYFPIDQINPHMIDAIISIEDKNFWEHNGIDILGILRAIKYNYFNKNKNKETLQGASTIEQQLIKNLLLTNEKSIERKIKEIILVYRLHQHLKEELKKQYNSVDKKTRKLKILERYLNYIPFGNNTFGIESATKKYFNTNAKDLSILQSSILASLPKGTTLYNPYTNKDILVGSFSIQNNLGKEIINQEIEQKILKQEINKIKKRIYSTKRISSIVREKNLENIIKSITLGTKYNNQKYTIKYNSGRKDIVLSKMLALKKITQKEYKQAIISGFSISFHKQKNYIKAPHFIFHIMGKIKEERGESMLKKGGLTIKTSLDYRIQQKTQEAINNNEQTLKKHNANNTAVIIINSQNGDIISYIGSKNFWNIDIQGQNDIIQSKRQLGSVMKPLFYAKAFDDINIGPETIIPDTPIKIGPHIPRNYDNKFKGNITAKKALAQSRNIPAIKIFFSLGEKKARELFQQLGLFPEEENRNQYKNKKNYGYNLILGGVETSIYKLTNAYRHLSNNSPAKINPILEIRDKNNKILYNKKNIQEKEKNISIFSKNTIQEIRKILSNYDNFETFTNKRLKKDKITLAIKSGTSSVKTHTNQDKSKDGVLIGYNNNYIAAIRAGNTDGSPMTADAYGLFLNINTLKSIQKLIQ